MKVLSLFTLLLSFFVLGACQTIRTVNNPSPVKPILTGPIEIYEYNIEKTNSGISTISGTLIGKNGERMPFIKVSIDSAGIACLSDEDGKYKLDSVPVGINTVSFSQIGTECTATLTVKRGDQIEFSASIAPYGKIELSKPIIYLYPKEKIEVEIELIYDGKITTTYPKYPTSGWKVTASPDGTLIDQNDKEYYALYWEGEPRKPLEINDGFVVSKEQTIPFLEEKLALLGLNSKESNEFIIFWLPILEKNNFNLIHFAGDDYLDQAKLNISPIPETIIRVAMVFQGLDEEIEVPMQDLTPLAKTRNGFTLVEWGGQELPKKPMRQHQDL